MKVDKCGNVARKACGRCAKRAPIMVDGYWIDFCQGCYDEWLTEIGPKATAADVDQMFDDYLTGGISDTAIRDEEGDK